MLPLCTIPGKVTAGHRRICTQVNAVRNGAVPAVLQEEGGIYLTCVVAIVLRSGVRMPSSVLQKEDYSLHDRVLVACLCIL